MPEEQLPEEATLEENEDVKSSDLYVQSFLDKLPDDYFLTIHGVKTIRWGGLLYLLHCIGYPEFQTTLLEAKNVDNTLFPLAPADTTKDKVANKTTARFIVRFQSSLRLYPSKAYADFMGWTAEDMKNISQMTHIFEGSATNINIRNANMTQFAFELAETRANCRSARSCLGIGMCSSEEMGSNDSFDEEISGSSEPDSQPKSGLVKGFASRCAVQSETNPKSGADISGDSREADLKAINSLKGIVPDGISIVASFMSYHKVMVIDQLKDSELKELRSKLTINP